MENSFKTGAEWRRWDLHLHTKDTYKSDEFTSADFNSFCDTLFKKALAKEISAIGITDYFNINNYKKLLYYLAELETNEKFGQEERDKIKSILIIPNIELLTTVTVFFLRVGFFLKRLTRSLGETTKLSIPFLNAVCSVAPLDNPNFLSPDSFI